MSHGKQTAEIHSLLHELELLLQEQENKLTPESKALLNGWKSKLEQYKAADYIYYVRGKEVKQPLYSESLSHLKIPKVSLPK